MQARRGAQIGEEAAAALGITKGTLYKLERGTHTPSPATAMKLAAWLGWTLEQVFAAAASPAPAPAEDVP